MSFSASTMSSSQSNVDFKITTKSGDVISLNMNKRESESQTVEHTDGETTMTSTKEYGFGYAFHYEGNGIDENDQKEIEEALKKVQPLMQKFVENISETSEKGEKTPSSLLDIMSGLISEVFEPTSDMNMQNYQKNGLAETMNNTMNLLKPVEKALDDIESLMLKVFMNIDGTAPHTGKTFYA